MASTMRDFSEKRDFYRMQVDSPIQVTDSEGNRYQGICQDLSGTGMKIRLDTALEEGSELHTHLPSQNEQFPPFETTVTVIRCQATESGYLLGTAITQVKR